MGFPHTIISQHQAQLPQWMASNLSSVMDSLNSRGAVLLRGFRVNGAEGFRDAITPVLGALLPYVEGVSPRTSRGAGVYTSTEYDPARTIALHNELSYAHQWPARIAFYCRKPAATGGHTPLADSRNIFARVISAGSELPGSRVRYVRHMHAGRGPGVGWPATFGTEDRDSVDTYCAANGIGHTWLTDGRLRTTHDGPWAIRHPRTAENVWFNQAHQWHPSNGGADEESLWRSLFGDELPLNAVHDDGSDIDPQLLRDIRAAFEAEQTMFDWREGDVLILDNMLTAHGRSPFTGEREVLVAMGAPVQLSTVTEVRTSD